MDICLADLQVVSREEEMAWLELRLEYSGLQAAPTSPSSPVSSPTSARNTPTSTSHLGRRSTVPIQLRLLPSLQVKPPATCVFLLTLQHHSQ